MEFNRGDVFLAINEDGREYVIAHEDIYYNDENIHIQTIFHFQCIDYPSIGQICDIDNIDDYFVVKNDITEALYGS